MTQPFIPVCRPYLTGVEKKYVLDAIETGWISSAGEYLNRFEKLFAEAVGCEHAVSCSNGTAAVHLALLAANVGPGDRVVVPSFTMMASVFPIIQQGAEPVFVDCDIETWTLDPKSLAKVQGPIKAIMPVHIYGHPCDMDPIVSWAKERNAIVIEDAAEGHGALYKNRPVGSLGDIAAFSFYANKILTCGEGGAITSNNSKYAERAAYFRNLCFDKSPEKRFIHEDIGYNYRLTNLQAALAVAQTEAMPKLVAMRREMASKYLSRLGHLAKKISLPVERAWAKNVYWMFGILLNEDQSVPTVVSELKKRGVDTRRFFYPGHLQPVFGTKYADSNCPNSVALWNRGIYLPSSSDLTDAEADQVASALTEVLG